MVEFHAIGGKVGPETVVTVRAPQIQQALVLFVAVEC